MGAVKLERFIGEVPRLASTLLPDMAAQRCVNTKLRSGALVPFRTSTSIVQLTNSGVVKAIYPMTSGTTTKWLSWIADVDIARAQLPNDTTQRIYYTGDGAPKVTNASLALTGDGPYPAASYTLGLPAPTTAPSIAAVSITTLNAVSRAPNYTDNVRRP